MRPRFSLPAVAVIFLSLASIGFKFQAVGPNEKGNELYQKGDYPEAKEYYEKAKKLDPQSGVIAYNIGNAYHKGRSFAEAQNSYRQALSSKDANLKAQTFYNLGNNLVRQEKIDAAIESYKNTLRINPRDEDAKYNIEFLRKKKEEQKSEQNQKQDQKQDQKQNQNQNQGSSKQGDQPQKDQQQGQGKEEEKNKGESKSQQSQSQPKEEKQDQKKESQLGEQKEDKEKEEQKSEEGQSSPQQSQGNEQKESPASLSPEELQQKEAEKQAEQILRALGNSERGAIQKRNERQRLQPPRKYVEKEW